MVSAPFHSDAYVALVAVRGIALGLSLCGTIAFAVLLSAQQYILTKDSNDDGRIRILVPMIFVCYAMLSLLPISKPDPSKLIAIHMHNSASPPLSGPLPSASTVCWTATKKSTRASSCHLILSPEAQSWACRPQTWVLSIQDMRMYLVLLTAHAARGE